MKQFLKRWMPPILLSKLFYLRSYKDFFKYKDLVSKNIELKDKHKGKRCFILGSGPSIKKEDLKPLKDEIVFALNNFYVHEDFQTIMSGKRDKYYMTAPIHPPQTEEEWKEWFKDMEKNMPKNANMLFGLNGNKVNIKYIFDKYNLFEKYKINWYFTGIPFCKTSFNPNAMNVNKLIYNAEAVSIYAIIIAIYMGFDEIYLLGMDHDYFLYDNEKDMRMYTNAKHQNNEFQRTFGDSFYVKEFLRQHNIFVKYRALNNYTSTKIYNASNGGLLKEFLKVNLKDLFE